MARGEGRRGVVVVTGEVEVEVEGVGGVEGLREREKKERRGEVGLEYLRGARVGGDFDRKERKMDQRRSRRRERDASESKTHLDILERLVHNFDRLNRSFALHRSRRRRHLVDGRWRRGRRIVEEVMSDRDRRSERRRKRGDGWFGS